MFRVVRDPSYSPAQFALAPRHRTVESAVAAMGRGMVFAADGRLVAFHESHLALLQRRADQSPA